MRASISMNCEVIPKVKVDKALKMSSNLISCTNLEHLRLFEASESEVCTLGRRRIRLRFLEGECRSRQRCHSIPVGSSSC